MHGLAIAHLDCDAFYATVEKRDAPTLMHRPVIVGGRHRGVVLACCYIARLYGVRSAMPMFKALRACPDAVVIPPDMEKYRRVGRQVRALMQELTPRVEPLSIDEAFLDLTAEATGTEGPHDASPATRLARLALRVEREIGVTLSVGLSYNKFLAKIASDLDKPRGFAVIGRRDAQAFLDPQPVGVLWGVGAALQKTFAADGIATVGRLRTLSQAEMGRRYGAIGLRLYHFARGEDDRRVDPDTPVKSISAETTFADDISDGDALAHKLWPLCQTVAHRLCAADLAGTVVQLKLKTAGFRTLTRSRTLDTPTQSARRLFEAGRLQLTAEVHGTAFRLIGIGCAGLVPGATADPPDLLTATDAPNSDQAK